MKTILVTGGCGFIGSHTSLILLNKGYKVIILDSNINSSLDVLGKIETQYNLINKEKKPLLSFIKGDIRNKKLLDSIFENAKISNNRIYAVIHFAGLKYVDESISKPLDYWDVNVNGSRVLLEVMLKKKCYNLIYSSSASVYGYQEEKPITEKSEIRPTTPYGITKASVEKMLDNVFSSMPNTWKIYKLRYFNPAGSHPSGILGEKPKCGYTNLFPKLSKIVFHEDQKLEIYGNDWPTKDGTCIRDYIHVLDLAEAHYEVLHHLIKNEYQLATYNLGSGMRFTMLEIIQTYSKVNNCKIPYIFKEKRVGDVPILYANIDLVKERIGWEPKRSINDICRDSWFWASKNK